LCLAEEGRWLRLESAPWRRGILAILSGGFLVFSTSRGSWSVAIGCILFMLFFARHRGAILRFLLVAIVGVSIWAHFADTSTLEKYIDKTFNSEEEWSDINARVAQWHAFPRAFADAPIFGFGPGMGKAVSLKYSGHQLIWHSLYEHISIECGSLGILLLLLLLGSRVRRGIAHLRDQKDAIPVLGVLGFMIIAISIPAIDGMAGLFLGLSLTAGHTLRYRVLRQVQFASQRHQTVSLTS
jgi:O-antigen ligase